jgi:hypothetical protein
MPDCWKTAAPEFLICGSVTPLRYTRTKEESELPKHFGMIVSCSVEGDIAEGGGRSVTSTKTPIMAEMKERAL